MIPEAVSLGRMVLSFRLLLLFLAAGGGGVAGWFLLGARRDALRRVVIDSLTTAVLLLLAGWKLVALVTQWFAIRREPLLLLWATGGRLGIFAGLAMALAYLGWKLGRVRRGDLGARDIARGMALVVSAAMIAYGVLFVGSAAAYAATGGSSTAARVGAVVPEFSLPLLNGEQALSPGDLRGRPALLNFWATWCGPCRAETVVKNRLAGEFGDRITVVGINLTHTEAGSEPVAAYVRERQIRYPVALDRDGRVTDRFGVRGTPTTVIVAPDGTVHTRFFGPLSYDRAAAVIEGLLTEASR
ncbi:MAG: hypothetical protein EA403_11030 [Spirochaetaceae bacterium]|nr:MAG: hypothetical protein EA403_11030 [Spirochaetaceae bacterium]